MLLLLFANAADFNVMLDTIVVLLVAFTKLAYIIKSPKVAGSLPECICMCVIEFDVYRVQIKIMFSVSPPVCVTVQVSVTSCPGQTGPAVDG